MARPLWLIVATSFLLPKTSPWVHKRYLVGDIPMHYVESGMGHGRPTIIFIHGTPGSYTAAEDLMRDSILGQRLHWVVPDRAGFGQSGQGTPVTSLAEHVRLLEPLLLQHSTDGRRVLLMGHSYGGPVAALMAMQHPDKVSSLFLVAASVDPGAEKIKWIQHVGRWPIVRNLLPSSLYNCNEEIFALKEQLQLLQPRWAQLRVPTVVLQGERDDLVPPVNADFIARHMQAQYCTILRYPHENHFIPFTKPELVRQAMLPYLP